MYGSSRYRPNAGIAASILTLALAGASASAAEPPAQRPSLQTLVAESDLVFRGVVESIDYALSEPGGQEQTRMPYSFVTYRVRDVLRGEAGGETVTLRFVGGYDSRNMHVLTTSITPRIDVGDEDILFVTGNGSRLCPLVGNHQGRYRVNGGQVYTEMGRSVTLNGEGDFEFGSMYRLVEVETTTVMGQMSLTGYGPEVKTLPSPSASVNEVKARIQVLAKDAAPAKPFASADPTQPITGPDMNPAPPPVDLAPQAVPDPEEEEMVEALPPRKS